MSARYEISEWELDVLAITGPEGTRYIDGEEIEARLIRQQSADIAELRAELAAVVAELNLERDECANQWAELEDARARLAAIDSAPVVAHIANKIGPDYFPCGLTILADSKLPPLGTDLIAKPAKD